MSVAIVTGSTGLVGSESVRHFASLGLDVVGIDNDMRSQFFGPSASTRPMLDMLNAAVPGYRHVDGDIRDFEALSRIFERYGEHISLVIHTAAQPSHDWAARDPFTDFSVNANGTLNLLEATRRFAPGAAFVFTSTNKVYGDRPNTLPLVELDSRWEIEPGHEYENGISETMSIDDSTHSLFGASKAAADLLVQEYGRYFGMNTVAFRCGCLTGPNHSGAMLHGFLSYLVKCAVTGTHYTVFGYKGKQVRDNLHSADLVRAFETYWRDPSPGEIYNMGGGRIANCSMQEAIRLTEELAHHSLNHSYDTANRIGDHIWWVSDLSKFRSRYPTWNVTHDIESTLAEMVEQQRWAVTA